LSLLFLALFYSLAYNKFVNPTKVKDE